jgi:hypothetical protein
MVYYVFCYNCGKVVDEYESKCFWCGCVKKEEEKIESDENGKPDNK